eukprot:g23612.t1
MTVLSKACLPAFNLLHRFVHFYFRVSLQRAFYHDGVDVLMPQVSKCPWVPILLFGATLNEFMRPNSKEAHSLFTLSQYAMGCQRRGDWLRFDRQQKWHTRRWPELLKQPHLASLFDRLPEMVLFAFIYLFCLLANDKSRPGPEDLEAGCQAFRFFTMMAILLIIVFIGLSILT